MSEEHPVSSLFLICAFFATASSVTKAAITPMLETTTEGDKCNWDRTGTREHNNQSCYLFISEPMTFYEANKSCEDEGAHMVSISNEEENALVVRMTKTNVWIGLYRLTNDSCAGSTCTNWMWLDGSDPGYFNWGMFYANPGQCVSMNADGKWQHGRYCSDKLGFVCKKNIPLTTSTSEPTTMMITSPMADTSASNSDECKWKQTDGIWDQADQKCYLLIAERMTFHQANRSCEDEGAHLVSIGNEEENALVVKMTKTNVWIGLYRLTNDNCAGNACTNWMWLDGSDPVYFNWGMFHPNPESDHFSIFMGIGVIVGIFVMAIIAGSVVCFMKRRHGRQMTTSKVTTNSDVSNYENVNVSASSHSLVISQKAMPEGMYANSITTDVSTRNHVDDTSNCPAYEEVTPYTAVSPEYTPLQFTDSTHTNVNR